MLIHNISICQMKLLKETAAGTDYWYVYNNTLFMNINTNNTSTAEHKAFMKEAIKENQDVR